MAETPPTAPVADVSPSIAPAVAACQSMASPALSEKTVAASDTRSTAPEEIADYGPLPVAGQGQALFSTNIGRQEPRAANPPYTPVIARSNMTNDVVCYARTLFNKYSWHYVCYFPNCGYDITDLFDGEDIHTLEPVFCKEVLKYITQDNVYRAQAYAMEWSLQNRDRIHIVAEVMFDKDDPLAVVKTVFVNDEDKYHPPHFLWHVANMIRMGMYNTAKKKQETSKAVDAGEEVKVASGDTGKSDLKPRPVAEVKLKVADGSKQPQCFLPPGVCPQVIEQPLMQVPGSSSLVPYQVSAQPFTPQCAMQAPQMGYPNHSPNPHIGGPAMMPSAHMNQPMLRNPKSRRARQSSGTFARPPPHSSWTENALPFHQSGPQYRQSSGIMPTMQPPYTHPQALAGQQPINAMMPSSVPNPHFMPPQMPHGQLAHPPVPYGPGMVPQQAVPYGPPTIDPGSQMHPGGTVPSGMHTGDMANYWRYPSNNNNQRMDQRSVPRRSSQADKQLGLYNPYGNDRPEWSSVLPQSNSRKGSRMSFSNPSGRGRRSSMAAQNRSSFDQAEYSSMHTGGHKESAYAPSSSHLPTSSHPPTSNNNKWKRIPNVVNDSEFGCDENWIGPKNTSVNHLFVFDIPNMRDERDHRMLESKVHEYFERNAGISVDSVHTKIDKRDTLIARVNFHSAADAAKSLKLNDSVFEGKKIAVKVPFHFYCICTNQGQAQSSHTAYGSEHPPTFQTQGGRRMSQVQLTSGSSMGDKGKQKTTYSPQDARSDLPQSHGIQDIPTVVTGSPEKDTSQNQIKFLPKKGNAKAASESALDQNNTVQLSTTVALEETQDQALEAANTQETKTMDTYKTELDSTKSEDNSVDKQVELSGPKEVATTDTTQQSKHDTVASAVSQVDDEKLSRHTTSESPDRESIPSKESSVGSPKSSQVKKDTCRDETASASSTADEESNKSDSTLDLSDRQKRGAQAHYETVSDDEQKNENSFVSAKESLSDVEKVEVKEDTDSMVEGVVPEDSSTMTSGNTGTAHAKPKDASSLLGTSTAPPEKSRVPPAAALPEKKVGAHATESLNPFGLSKVQQRAQRKKEQEAKKKQRKKKDKEREEAKKAKKLDKHILLPSTAFQAGSDQPQATETPALKSEKLETADNHSHAPGSRDGYTEDAKQNLDSKIQVQSKDAKFDQDKRTEASTDVLANPYEGIELGSPQMTPQMAPNQDVHQPPKASSPSQDARSSTPEGCAKQAAQGLEKLYTEETELQQGVKAKKAAPIKVAVPNLKLAVTKSATSSKAPSNTSSPTDALATTVKDSNRTNLAKNSNTLEAQTILPGGSLEELTKIKGETEIIDLSSEDNVSTATSATIQASLGRASPSPSAADFHTPLQTPSGLASQQAAQPKKKTKRGGKKAKKNALAPPTQPAAAGEPFAEQLKQVEGLTGINEFPYHSSSSGMSYYQSRENVATDSAAANDASNDATPSEARVADNKNNNSVFDEILVYMKEKEQAMDAIPRNILAQHGADIPPVKLSWEQVEHIVGGPNKNSTKFGTEVAGSGDDPAPKASEELPSNDDSEGSNEASSATLSAG